MLKSKSIRARESLRSEFVTYLSAQFLLTKLLVQLLLDRSMVAINTVRPGANCQQIVRNANAVRQLASQLTVNSVAPWPTFGSKV